MVLCLWDSLVGAPRLRVGRESLWLSVDFLPTELCHYKEVLGMERVLLTMRLFTSGVGGDCATELAAAGRDGGVFGRSMSDLLRKLG